MSRLDTIGRSSMTPMQSKRPATRGKKTLPQDRLSQRTLLWRRVRRNLLPALWITAVGLVLLVGVELIHTLPQAPLSSHKMPVPALAPMAPVAVSSTSSSIIQPSLLAEALAGFGFRIDKIEIHGTSTTTPAAVAAAMGVKAGEPIFGFSLKAMQQRIQSLGPVQSVVVERLLPGTLVVDVTERDLYAIWQTMQNGQPVFQVIDKKGDVITGQDAALAKRREPSLLLISGMGAPQQASTLIPELQAVPSVFSHVAAAERMDELRWNLILKNHTVVKLPAENEQAALAQLASLQNSIKLLDRPVESIDLRQSGRLIIRPYAVAPSSTDQHHYPKSRQEGQ